MVTGDDSMLLQVFKTRDGNKVTVSPKGVINTDTVSVFNDVLDGLSYEDLDLTLDFSGLSYITSAGLRALLIARKRLTEETMRIIHMNQAVRDVFEISGFSGFIPVVSAAGSRAMPRDPSFRQLLSYRTDCSPDHKIIFCDERGYTWREIDDASQIAAKDLHDLGVRKGTHLGMFARNTINWIIAFFAAQKLGAVVALLNYSLKPEEIKKYSAYGDITHLCFDRTSAKMDAEAFTGAITGGEGKISRVYDISRDIDFFSRAGELAELRGRFEEEYDADDPCVMIFTSGTTGVPKGVLSSAHDRLTNSRLTYSDIRPTENDRMCLFLPLCHVFGFSSALNLTMLYDTPLYMPSDISDQSLLDTIEKNGCTLFNSVPTKILSMAGSAYFDSRQTATLRACIIAGSAITAQQMTFLRGKMPHTHFISLYGMSEMAPISMTKYNDTPEHITQTVGRPVNGVIVEIRDRVTGREKPAGEEGEIFVQSATSLICYYKMDLESQILDGGGWISTGDLGYLDGEGYLHLTGRCKDLIIRGGENIAPKEIEEVISQVDEIRDVRVVGVPDDKYGEIIAAAVVLSPGAHFDGRKVGAHILSHLAGYKVPEYYVLFDAFPLLANGKIDMLSLKKTVAGRRNSPANL